MQTKRKRTKRQEEQVEEEQEEDAKEEAAATAEDEPKRNATRMRWHKRHESNLRQLENTLLSPSLSLCLSLSLSLQNERSFK